MVGYIVFPGGRVSLAHTQSHRLHDLKTDNQNYLHTWNREAGKKKEPFGSEKQGGKTDEHREAGRKNNYIGICREALRKNHLREEKQVGRTTWNIKKVCRKNNYEHRRKKKEPFGTEDQV